MTIIIETPAPPTRERLVLVPPESCTPVLDDGKPAGLSIRAQGARDATPADLERGGWVLEMEPTGPGTLAHLRADLRDMTARAEKAERALAGLRDQMEVERERADQAEREPARLTAPAEGSEGEPTDAQLEAMWTNAMGHTYAERRRLIWRAGERAGAAHERARQAQPAKGRATDEELVAIGRAASEGSPRGDKDWRAWRAECDKRIVRAIAERVRQGPGLVERLVADPWLDSVSVDAVMGGAIRVRVVRRVDSLANTLGAPKEAYCSRADVPSTIARLAGLEVSRG